MSANYFSSGANIDRTLRSNISYSYNQFDNPVSTYCNKFVPIPEKSNWDNDHNYLEATNNIDTFYNVIPSNLLIPEPCSYNEMDMSLNHGSIN